MEQCPVCKKAFELKFNAVRKIWFIPPHRKHNKLLMDESESLETCLGSYADAEKEQEVSRHDTKVV
jgi:hypothetical protein